MNFIKRVLRKLRGIKPTEKEISANLCQKIRNGGGEVGDNVDIFFTVGEF